MSKLLSICIPSFNMEEYLSRCVDSMLVDEVLDQLEIIIVNDGSKDGTLAIANDYKQRYPQSVVVIDKPNGHYGSCINASLKVATGKYFRIVDADDWVDSQALAQLVKKLNDLVVDCVCTKFTECRAGIGDSVIAVNDVPANVVLDLNEFIVPESCHKMHSLTYATDLLRRIDYRQTEGICYTDTQYVYFPLSCARSFYFIDISLYQYFLGRDDQSMAPRVLVKNNDQYIKIVNSIQEYHKGNHPFNGNEKHLWSCMLGSVLEMSIPYYVLFLDYNKTKEHVFRTAMKELRQQGTINYHDVWSQNVLRVVNLWYSTGGLSRLWLMPIKAIKRKQLQ